MYEQPFQQALFTDDDFRRAVHHFQQGVEQVSYIKREEQANTAFLIKTEILEFLLEAYSEEDENLMPLYDMLATYNEKSELSSDTILHLFMEIFSLKNRTDV